MSELLRSDELKMREESGDASAAIVPTVHLHVEHPFRVDDRIRDPKGEMCFFFPRECLWASSAKGFGQLKGALIPNSTACYKSMIEAVFLTSQRLGEGMENGLQRQFVTWTVVPSVDDENQYAGFLVRCIYQLEMDAVHKFWSAYLDDCDEMEKSAIKKGRQVGASYWRFTHNAYVNTCDYYMGKSVADRARGFQDLDDPDNPYNPLKVFSLDVALQRMKNAGAAVDFCRRIEFLDAGGGVSFPRDGECTYLVASSQLAVANMNKIFMPHAPRSEVEDTSIEYLLFQRNAGGDRPVHAAAADDSEAEDGGAPPDAEQRRRNYLKMATNTEADASTSLDSFKKRVKKRMALARRAAGDDEYAWAKERRAAQIECIRWFMTDIFTTDDTADVGDSLKRIAKWYNEHLVAHTNFMMPSAKYSANLSRFGDMQAAQAAESEAVWAINTAHAEIKSLRLACMHVYFYSPFHCHTCLFGQPGAGKSNAFQVNNSMMIDGTTRDIGSESAKAKMTPGKKTDLSVETFEDIPPSQLGVSNFNGGGPGRSSLTSNTDQESLLKYRLTKGRVKGVYKKVVNGVHSMMEVDSFCNTVMLIGMNALLSQVPKSISDRFNNIQFQHRARLDHSGNDQSMFQKHQLADDRDLDATKQSLIRRAHRNQCFHAIIQLLCWSGVFEKPDLSVPVLIWKRTLSLAQQKGLQETTNVRHFERLGFHCSTLVVEDAIDRVLDSEFSPLDPDEPFKIEDIIHFEKHLYGNTEHAAFTLGLMQHQFESPVISAVEKFFHSKFLRHKINQKDIGKLDAIPELQNEMSYYYVAKFEASVQSNSSNFDREKAMQLSEQLRRLAIFAHKQMNPKPSVDEVVYALQCLHDLQIDVDSNTKPGEKIRIPSLAFSRDGEVMIAEHMMRHYETDRLKQCLKEVLSHEFTRPKNLLFGRVHENCPFLWQMLPILPTRGKRLVMDNPKYFSHKLLRLTHRSVEGVSRSLKHGVILSDELAPEESTRAAFSALFSETPHVNIDLDLDTFASQIHAAKIGLEFFPPTPDAPNFDTSPEALTVAVRASLTDDAVELLEKYPRALCDSLGAASRMAQKQDQRDHPEKYSATQIVKQSQKRKRDEREDELDESKSDEEMEDAAPPAHVADLDFASDNDNGDGDFDADSDADAPPARQNSFAAGLPPVPPPSFVWTGVPAAASASPIPAQPLDLRMQGYVSRLSAYP